MLIQTLPLKPRIFKTPFSAGYYICALTKTSEIKGYGRNPSEAYRNWLGWIRPYGIIKQK